MLMITATSQRLTMRLLVGRDRRALSSEVVEVGEGAGEDHVSLTIHIRNVDIRNVDVILMLTGNHFLLVLTESLKRCRF